MDFELLEQLLDSLATPISRWQTTRANVVKQFDGKISLRKMATALDAETQALQPIHDLIMDYARTVGDNIVPARIVDGKEAERQFLAESLSERDHA